MLNRQQVALAMMREHGGLVSRLRFTKWLFLLGQESPSKGGRGYYQFVPYKYGPYSFTLFQEMAALERNGYLMLDDQQQWVLTEDGRSYQLQLPADVRRNVREIVRLYERMSTDELLDVVYRRHPWFASKSEKVGNCVAHPVARLAVYTMGYEGLLVEGFMNDLLMRGVRRIVDVRSNPVSRRYGFHKSTLSRLCRYLDMGYEHFPELGIPSEQRSRVSNTKDQEDLFERYKRYILPTQEGGLQRVTDVMSETAGVLICVEANPQLCHRSRLADAIGARSNLPIEHLGWPR